jgi:uncharacterized membrane protein YtjA (UPF0391 family)
MRTASRRDFVETVMSHYTVVFLAIALIAALLGITAVAGAATGVAAIVFLVLAVSLALSRPILRRQRVSAEPILLRRRAGRRNRLAT